MTWSGDIIIVPRPGDELLYCSTRLKDAWVIVVTNGEATGGKLRKELDVAEYRQVRQGESMFIFKEYDIWQTDFWAINEWEIGNEKDWVFKNVKKALSKPCKRIIFSGNSHFADRVITGATLKAMGELGLKNGVFYMKGSHPWAVFADPVKLSMDELAKKGETLLALNSQKDILFGNLETEWFYSDKTLVPRL